MTTFPQSPLDLRPELLINRTWTDVSARLDRGNIEIGRGHPDESLTVSASTLALPLNNSDGALSMSNPNSPYYPYLVRNTRARVSVPAQTNCLRLDDDLPGSEGMAYASCPSTSALNITGTLDLRVWCDLTDWSASTLIAAKWNTSTDKAWAFYLADNAGTLQFEWYTGSGDWYVPSSAPVTAGKQVLRVVFTGTSCTFYTGPAYTGPWTQIGNASAFSSLPLTTTTAPLCLGYSPGYAVTDPHTGFKGARGRIFGAQLYSGSTLVASPDFTAAAAGAATVTDAQGNAWTPANGAWVCDRDFRAYAELAAFPQSGDPRWADVTVNAEGGGLLRRLAQRQQDVQSPMYRAELLQAGVLFPVQYWPCEQLPGSGNATSATGGPPMVIEGGTGDGQAATTGAGWGQCSAFACSAPLPDMNGSTWSGGVPRYTSTGNTQVVRFLLDLSQASYPTVNSTGLVEVIMRGSPVGSVWLNLYNTASGGGVGAAVYDPSGNLINDTNGGHFPEALGPAWWSLEIAPVSGGVEVVIAAIVPGADVDYSYVATGTVSGSQLGTVRQVRVNPEGSQAGVGIGHITVQNGFTSLFNLQDPLDAWQGEAASARFLRLCGENGVPARLARPGAGTPMGQQQAGTLTQLLTQVIQTDAGTWLEPRDSLSWGYVPSAAMVHDPVLTLDYSQAMLSEWSQPPTEDDQVIVNDVTVTAADGAIARQWAGTGQAVDGGRLSTRTPPLGAGTYDTQVQANPASDDGQLNDIAAWLVHAGTVDEPRLPGITLDLTAADLSSVFWQVLGLDVAQILQISNLPANLRPGSIREVAQHLTETLGSKTLKIAVTGVPGSAWDLLVLDNPVRGLADTDGSQLASGVTATATSLSVQATGTVLWDYGNTAVPFDIRCGGERLTVTHIAGTSSPQTFTVTRSVNGVSKTHSAGDAVSLWQPNYLAIGP